MPVEQHRVAQPKPWSTEDAERLYGVWAWGQGVFRITEGGHLAASPAARPGAQIDLFEVVESLRERGLNAPLLIRLCDVLADRLRTLRNEFDAAIERHGYNGAYRCLYPIKVNQERHLCEEIRDLAEELDFGFEAGSKPELLAALGLTTGQPRIPIMCNGFKDEPYLETVALAAKLGRDIVPIVENPRELEVILAMAQRHGVRPRFGLRMKLQSAAVGHWESTGGAGSKFGLHASEVLWAVDVLREAGMTDCLELLHCHVGSQVNELTSLRAPLEELARTHVELASRGFEIKSLDVGGGLGVDYDGSHTSRGSSVDYGITEYADLVIGTLGEAIDAAGLPHPDIYSESGRAMVAGSSVLVVDVLQRLRFPAAKHMKNTGTAPDPATNGAMRDLQGTADELRDLPTPEALRRAREAFDRVVVEYRRGGIGLVERARAEGLFARIAAGLAKREEEAHQDEVRRLAAAWGDLYVGNFSVFQSLPDSWALDQVFPVCPLHRLNERPTRSATLVDVTCDSDGVVDRFTLDGMEWGTLDVHELRGNEPYYLGIFLVGAYQEILGDLHNLFGDPHAVHVRLDDDGTWMLGEVVPGDTVRDVLDSVHYDPAQLLERMRREVEVAIRGGSLTVAEGKGLLANIALGLDGYTYLE